MSQRIALRLVLVFTLLPPALCLAGFMLSSLFGCSGSFRMETCLVAGAYRIVAPLLVMGWVSLFTVPCGFVAAVFLLAVRWWRCRTRRSLT